MTQRLLLALCLLLASSLAAAYEWKAVVSPKDQIYPSLILATSDLPAPRSRSSRVLGDANGLIGVRVLAEHDQQRARGPCRQHRVDVT